MQSIKIDIVSDVVCPWCYLGQRRLGLALASLAGEISADITWKPFQLEPDAPPEGLDAFAYLARKIGGAERVRQSHAMLTGMGAEIGLPFAFEKTTIIPNTLDAHRLLLWAGQVDAQTQNQVAQALFTANFVEGRNVGDHAVLADIATAAGLDGTAVAHRLGTEENRETVRQDIDYARRMGVSGVPFFVIDGKYAISGAQGVDVFADALRQIAATKASL
ncbi:MAG: DsbA family oxidoreductase [Rhizobium sp.]|nr:DsbA family oxidoreductase [Rhizobium sp.]